MSADEANRKGMYGSPAARALLESKQRKHRYHNTQPTGEVSEWLKAHAWKACLRQKRNVGSNPTLSAIKMACSDKLSSSPANSADLTKDAPKV